MKRIMLLIPLLLLICSSPALAAEKFYFAVRGAYSYIDAESTLKYYGSHEFDKKYGQGGFSLAFGMPLKKLGLAQPRIELESTTRFGNAEMKHNNYLDKVKVGVNNSTLLNFYLDFPIGETVTPYIGASAGLFIFDYEAKTYFTSGLYSGYVRETGTGAAFQGGLAAGVAFKVSQKVSLDLTARYLWSSVYEVDYDDKVWWETEIQQNMADFMLGLRYYF